MARIKIEGDFFGEESYENNYALEYLKRELNDHAESNVLDHPDGSVTKEKLSAEIRDTLTLNSSGITNHEVRVKKLENESHTHTNKDVLDTITSEKTAKWDSYENTISKEKTANAQKFSVLEALLSTKADGSETDSKLEAKANKADVLTRTETYMLLNDVIGMTQELDREKADIGLIEEFDRKKADKADVQTLREDITISSEYIRNHDTDIRNLEEGKADKADTYTKSEVYSQEETDSKLKSTYTWQLIGEAKLSEDGKSMSVVLPNDITAWYGETLMLVEIPKSETINGETNGNVSILGRKNGSTVCRIYVTASANTTYGALDPTWINRWAVITQWFGKKPISTNISRARGSGTAYSLSSLGTTAFSNTETIDEATEIVFSSSNEFIFPKGSSFKMYGRF